MTALHEIEAVAIGGSAGALEALSAILPALPADFAPPVIIVLHLPAGKPSILPSVLAARCRLPVREPDDKEPLAPSTVYVAPPSYHLLIEKQRTFAFSLDAPVQFSRPSIDVFFESAADAFGPKLAGVLLTGANEDGARGLRRIKAAGGLAIVQAPSTASARAMPEAGIRIAKAEHVLPPSELGAFISQLVVSKSDSAVRLQEFAR